tara:strand:- start:209 stop:514 length:306 start_codon:yes stop_codon:yes gene_type:complete
MFFVFVIMPIIMMQKLPILSLVIEEVDHPENPHFQFHFLGKPARRTLIFPMESYIDLKSEGLFLKLKNTKDELIKLPKYIYKDKEKFSWSLSGNKLKLIKQ